MGVCDERDTSMDPAYRKELQDMLKGKAMILPQVFVKGEYIGGVEQIRHLHETGYLGELLKVFPSVDHAFAFAGEVCSIPDLQLESEGFQENKVKMRCFLCNENGLMRCPSC
ncbi:hypothetical protein Leryth_023747 [Lithospermum erythrorhizon]|nr:hypothetical protein Leryth_023747 [Lithospermum erythrorhizon]